MHTTGSLAKTHCGGHRDRGRAFALQVHYRTEDQACAGSQRNDFQSFRWLKKPSAVMLRCTVQYLCADDVLGLPISPYIVIKANINGRILPDRIRPHRWMEIRKKLLNYW
ncbi:AVN_HP_G0120070.mRNA.1.CDS.1 [Saccharomyces cerevisiae]|nr:AVN_HP_G0120070.mRNA.1.CDS.1 [Saccharomyces cerevisiae]CAI6997160.1 AVN_HP_G0120070.mRNA.1.CDS.1 [Saccharomyces cerevisiae]